MNPLCRIVVVFAFAWLATSLATLLSPAEAIGEEGDQGEALRLFEQRIMPIFRSANPSSCVQCHLSSVDLKDYILPSHSDTFLALRDGGLIDLQAPSQSKILTLIRMGEQDLDQGARLIHEKTRQAELEAFSAWIEACCQDKSLTSMSASNSPRTIGPAKPLEVVRHARKSRLAESFTRNVWSQRMRCFPCHTPYEIDSANPNHQVPGQRQHEFVEKYGAKMNLFQKTPEETMSRLIAASRRTNSDRYPLINLADPKNSLLVLKPTSKVPAKLADGNLAEPSSSDPVSHMGGLKMHVNDQSYKAMVSWIEDYAAVVGDRYVAPEDLPDDNWVPTERILRLAEVPESWGPTSTVQLFVHSHDAATDQWSQQPIAFTQGTITPRRFVNGPLFLIRSDLHAASHSGTDDSLTLAPGKYLIKVYLDTKHRLVESPSLLLDETDFIGQAMIEAKWQIGFPKAETFSAATMTKPSP